MEDALAGLPQEIERWKETYLSQACRRRDEAKAYYDAALGNAPAPEFIPHSYSPAWQQRRFYNARLSLPAASENNQRAEKRVAYVQDCITKLEARLAKLQALSSTDRSAHTSPACSGQSGHYIDADLSEIPESRV